MRKAVPRSGAASDCERSCVACAKNRLWWVRANRPCSRCGFCLRSGFEEFFDLGHHGVVPDLVAFGAGVEEVGHDVGGECAVGSEEFVAEVEEEDLLVVGEGG